MSAEAEQAPPGQRWTAALVLSALALCAALFVAHLVQTRRVAIGTEQVLALKEASADLDEAFLHLQLAGDAESPWQRTQGLALLTQAEETLRRVGAAAGQAEQAREVAQAVATLRGGLAQDGGNRLPDVRARLALHQLRRQLSALDDAVRQHAVAGAQRLDAVFKLTLVLAALALVAIGLGLLRGERRRSQVQQRQRDSERANAAQLEQLVQARTHELQGALQAQRELEAFARTITDHQPTLLAYWDRTRRLRFVNKAYLDWFGLQRDAVLGAPMEAVIDPGLVAKMQGDVERVLQQGEAFESAMDLRNAAGDIGHFWTYRLPDRRDDGIAGYFFIATNVTALKQAEQQLERLNLELSRRAEQAESATRAKSAFLANMSHEIRTPMNAIIGLTHLMRRDTTDPPQRERLGKIDSAARHLLQVINDILDLSKIEAGKLQLADEPFGRDELVARALALVSDSAREKGLQLIDDTAALPARMRGDAKSLAQALINLLGNAVKFTEHGHVRLRGRVVDENRERLLLRFEVEDTGVGVPPERQAALFHAFEQVDNSSTRRHGGTGLGLTLTRHLARLMGGEAGLQSEPGQGSTFWFSAWVGRETALDAATPAPADSAAGDSAALAAALRREHGGQRVLLAEDNAINQEVAVELLRAAGLQVDVAGDGAQAVERALAGRYDLVLMDVQMPVMDGMAATREIRRRAGPELHIIAMTANAFAEDRAACLDAGMNDHLGKPVGPDNLYATLLRWLPAAPTVAATPRPAPPAAAPDPLAAIEGLDLATALRNVGGRPATVARVLRTFASTYADGHPALRLPPAGETLAQLRSACHSLRGACGTVGAVLLSDALKALETRLEDPALAPASGPQALHCDELLRALVRQIQAALQEPVHPA